MTLRVMLVDDDARFRKMARRALMAEGVADLAEVEDGALAAEAVEAFRPDVVLVDIRMPGIDGLEVTRRLQLLPGGGPRVILISTVDTAYGRQVASTLAVDYLRKDQLSLAAILELSAGPPAPEKR